MQADLWKDHIERFGDKRWGGDWWFLKAVLETEPSIYWYDQIVADARQLGRGRKFETDRTDWFLPVMEQYEAENLGDGDWRLRLWMR
jgi:hypothetical protein